MTEQTPIKSSRVRASEKAITVALRSIQAAGLPVDKVCITGGRIEIHCRGVEEGARQENDGGLEQW